VTRSSNVRRTYLRVVNPSPLLVTRSGLLRSPSSDSDSNISFASCAENMNLCQSILLPAEVDGNDSMKEGKVSLRLESASGQIVVANDPA